MAHKTIETPDLSVEVAVLFPKSEELFDEAVREEARFKLKEMAFNVDGYLRRLHSQGE